MAIFLPFKSIGFSFGVHPQQSVAMNIVPRISTRGPSERRRFGSSNEMLSIAFRVLGPKDPWPSPSDYELDTALRAVENRLFMSLMPLEILCVAFLIVAAHGSHETEARANLLKGFQFPASQESPSARL
jgi:hypothetical protein